MSGHGRRRMPYPPPESRWRRQLSPLEAGALLLGLALVLACCGGCMLLAVFGPPQPAPIVYVTPTPDR